MCSRFLEITYQSYSYQLNEPKAVGGHLLPVREEMDHLFPVREEMDHLLPVREEMVHLLPVREEMVHLLPVREEMVHFLPVREEMVQSDYFVYFWAGDLCRDANAVVTVMLYR